MRRRRISLINFSTTPTDEAKGDNDVDRTDFNKNFIEHFSDHTVSRGGGSPVDKPERGREAVRAGPQSCS